MIFSGIHYAPPITGVTVFPDLHTLHLSLYGSTTAFLEPLVLPNLEYLTLEHRNQWSTSRVPIAGLANLQERSVCLLLHLYVSYLRVELSVLVAFVGQLHILETLELDMCNVLGEALVVGLTKSLAGPFLLPAHKRIVLKDDLLISDEHILDMVESRLGTAWVRA